MVANSASKEQIFEFALELAGIPPDRFNSMDIFGGNFIDGDDAFNFMEEYSKKFGVNLDSYRWYFHHGEEGFNIGAIFFKPPYARVKSIPMTMEMLISSATEGRWMLKYPDHTLPDKRTDLSINLACTVVCVLLLIAAGLAKFSAQ